MEARCAIITKNKKLTIIEHRGERSIDPPYEYS
jgi:hypothetical protein